MRFKAKPWSIGKSTVVTIPYVYLENGYIDPEKEYVWICEEVQDETETKSKPDT